MSRFGQYRWFVLAGVITLAFAGVSLTVPRGAALTAISDVGSLLLYLVVAGAMLANACSERGANRRFWALMGAGGVLWAANQAAWVYCEVVRRTTVPDPWFMDVFLFLHLVPMIAAVGLRPHRSEGDRKLRVGALDFLLLLVWWVFLYAFVVFPWQYVSLNMEAYHRNYSSLYMLESGVLMLMLGLAARGAPAGWKMVYLNLMTASGLYAFYGAGFLGVTLAFSQRGVLLGKSLRYSVDRLCELDGSDRFGRARVEARSRSGPGG